MPLSKDLREFVELLNSNGVEYLVVGAFAVFYHGFARYTGDIDFLVRPSGENSRRVLAALAQFGFGSVGVQAEDFQSPGKVVQLGVSPNRIDIITSISGVTFDEAWDSRTPGHLDGIARNCGNAARQNNPGNVQAMAYSLRHTLCAHCWDCSPNK
jgi:hypothetical protein